MVYALSWFFVASLVALWSLLAWVLHGLAVWTVSNAGTVSGVASEAAAITLPEWLAPWVSPDIAPWVGELLAGLGPWIDGLLQAAPALVGGLTVVTWVVWGLGTALLLLLGAGLHGLIALWRRGGGRAGPGAGSPLAAR